MMKNKKTKKTVSLLLAVAMVLSLAACSKQAAEEIPEDTTEAVTTATESEATAPTLMQQLMATEPADPEDFLYTDLADGTLHILEYLGNSDIVVVPGEIEGKEVSMIDSYVFAQDCGVRAVKLPDSVKVIKNYAFPTSISRGSSPTNEQQMILRVISEWEQIMNEGDDTPELVDEYMQNGLGKALYKLSKGTNMQRIYREYGNK